MQLLPWNPHEETAMKSVVPSQYHYTKQNAVRKPSIHAPSKRHRNAEHAVQVLLRSWKCNLFSDPWSINCQLQACSPSNGKVEQDDNLPRICQVVKGSITDFASSLISSWQVGWILYKSWHLGCRRYRALGSFYGSSSSKPLPGTSSSGRCGTDTEAC